jgi:hypothetical protein
VARDGVGDVDVAEHEQRDAGQDADGEHKRQLVGASEEEDVLPEARADRLLPVLPLLLAHWAVFLLSSLFLSRLPLPHLFRFLFLPVLGAGAGAVVVTGPGPGRRCGRVLCGVEAVAPVVRVRIEVRARAGQCVVCAKA